MKIREGGFPATYLSYAELDAGDVVMTIGMDVVGHFDESPLDGAYFLVTEQDTIVDLAEGTVYDGDEIRDWEFVRKNAELVILD